MSLNAVNPFNRPSPFKSNLQQKGNSYQNFNSYSNIIQSQVRQVSTDRAGLSPFSQNRKLPEYNTQINRIGPFNNFDKPQPIYPAVSTRQNNIKTQAGYQYSANKYPYSTNLYQKSQYNDYSGQLNPLVKDNPFTRRTLLTHCNQNPINLNNYNTAQQTYNTSYKSSPYTINGLESHSSNKYQNNYEHLRYVPSKKDTFGASYQNQNNYIYAQSPIKYREATDGLGTHRLTSTNIERDDTSSVKSYINKITEYQNPSNFEYPYDKNSKKANNQLHKQLNNDRLQDNLFMRNQIKDYSHLQYQGMNHKKNTYGDVPKQSAGLDKYRYQYQKQQKHWDADSYDKHDKKYINNEQQLKLHIRNRNETPAYTQSANNINEKLWQSKENKRSSSLQKYYAQPNYHKNYEFQDYKADQQHEENEQEDIIQKNRYLYEKYPIKANEVKKMQDERYDFNRKQSYQYELERMQHFGNDDYDTNYIKPMQQINAKDSKNPKQQLLYDQKNKQHNIGTNSNPNNGNFNSSMKLGQIVRFDQDDEDDQPVSIKNVKNTTYSNQAPTNQRNNRKGNNKYDSLIHFKGQAFYFVQLI